MPGTVPNVLYLFNYLNKNTEYPIIAHKALHHPAPITTLSFAYWALVPGFFTVIKIGHLRAFAWTIPPSGIPFSLLLANNPSLSFRSPFKCHFLLEAIPDTPPLLHSPSSLRDTSSTSTSKHGHVLLNQPICHPAPREVSSSPLTEQHACPAWSGPQKASWTGGPTISVSLKPPWAPSKLL